MSNVKEVENFWKNWMRNGIKCSRKVQLDQGWELPVALAIWK